MKIDEIDFENLITRLEQNAWYAKGNDEIYIIISKTFQNLFIDPQK